MNQGKVFLVRPRGLVAEERGSYPLSLVAVLSTLENINFAARIVDFDLLCRQGAAFSSVCRDLLAEVEQAERPVVGISVNDASLPEALYLAGLIKGRAKRSAIVLGGPGVYFNSAGIIAEFGDVVDYIVRGEADGAFPELISRLTGGGARQPASRVIDSPKAANMDDCAFPRYDKVPPAAYSKGLGVEYFPVLAGAGCSNHCRYCSTSNFWGHAVRYKSVERLLRELSLLRSLGVSKVELVHDNLFHDMGFVTRLAEALVRKGTGVSWACSGRADDFDAAAAPLLARSGCRRIFWGIESGSERGLGIINKGLALEPSLRKVREVSGKHGICSQLSFIYNFPGDDLESFRQTLDLAFRLKAENPGMVQVALNNFLALSGAAFTGSASLERSRHLMRQLRLGANFGKRVSDAGRLFSFFLKPADVTTLGEKFRLGRMNFILNGFPGTITVLLGKYGLLEILKRFQRRADMKKAVEEMKKEAGAGLPASLSDIFSYEYLGAVPPGIAPGERAYRLLETSYDPSDLSPKPRTKRKRYLFFYRGSVVDIFEVTPGKFKRFESAAKSGGKKKAAAVLEIGKYAGD